jgi:cell wall-associated NlpC family hydrolase
VRVGARRLGPVLGAVAALGVAAAVVGRPVSSHHDADSRIAAAGQAASASRAAAGLTVDEAYAQAIAGTAARSWPAADGTQLPDQPGAAARAVEVAQTSAASAAPVVAPLHKLRQADLLVVAPESLRPAVAAAIRRLPGVTATARLDAATIKVNGTFVQMLGVHPSAFRAFAAAPTARSTSLWRRVASGEIAVSYTMGKQDKLPLDSSVHVAGQRAEDLRVGGYGTVGIAGVDAVVSDTVARSLGLPEGNALVISAPHAQLAELSKRVKAALPKGAGIAQLVAQVQPNLTAQAAAQATADGAAGATSVPVSDAASISPAQVEAFLKAALSRVGMPYVWGAAGPRSFDCSGLVQWSMRQAGIVMPRVAVDQARTGPRVPLSQLAVGDLLFYHTDATAPTYISHVAIYLGHGLMVQAPEPGMNVQIVQADFGSGFAGAVQVSPALAATVAGDPAAG